MKVRLPLLGSGIVACCIAAHPASAQENQQAAELALDSLLMMPVSTASKYEQKQSDAPAFITIVTHDEIQRFGYRTLEEVLQAQTGFYSANDRQFADAGFRGVGRPGHYNNKILVLVDGHTINDAITGGARLGSASVVELDDLERIEIVRGPGSALYGARAMLAVVNMVTRKGRDLDGLEAKGSVGTPQAFEASLRYGKVLSAVADVAASVSWASSDGEDIYFPEMDFPIMNNGVSEGMDWERLARGLVTFRYGDLFVQGGVANRVKGIPTGAYQTAFNHPDAETIDRIMYAEARYVRNLGPATELTARGYADSYEYEGNYPFASEVLGGDSTESSVVAVSADAKTLGGEVQIRWDPGQSHRLVLGVSAYGANRATVEYSGNPAAEFSGAFPYFVASGFIQEEYQVIPTVLLTLGLRHDEYSTRGSATTPRGALVFHPDESATIKLLAGGAFRAPNIFEMHINSPATALIGNVNLSPERIQSFEVIWEQRLGKLATTISAYHSEIRDLIDLMEVQTPDSLTEYGTLAFEQQNISDARSVGFDVEARFALPFGILARVGYGLQEATDRATGRRLVNAPRHLARLSASGSNADWGTLGVNLRAESGRRTLYYTETEPSVVVDVTVTSRPIFKSGKVQLIAKNLFDTDYSTPGGFQHLQAAIPQRGRTFVLRTSVSW